jgi:hypothetical protein
MAAKERKKFTSAQQPVNQDELAEGDENQKRPDKSFAEAQAALSGGGEPELKFGGTERNDVAVAKNRVLNRHAVDGGERIGGGGEVEILFFLKFQNEVLVPDAVVVKLQIIARRASDAERKTAGSRLAARLFSRKDVELNHQMSRRFT